MCHVHENTFTMLLHFQLISFKIQWNNEVLNKFEYSNSFKQISNNNLDVAKTATSKNE